MTSRERVVKYHAEHGNEFRLRCMIGAAKGYARLAKTEEEKQKHLETAAKLQHELDKEKTMFVKLKEEEVINTANVNTISWSSGKLYIYWQSDTHDSYSDPDKLLYNKLCEVLEVK